MNSPSPQPSWPPPKAPLPPHRLAKLANALGISTPLPAQAPSHPVSSPLNDQFRRSPTPSNNPPPVTTKYLLHVIPPIDLPQDDPDLLPIPSHASGYHTQFRRGVLVPVHSTLQSQLSAIAREYALPGSSGIILYLITATTDGDDEPGPRLSDDIWKHIWSRVILAEQKATPPDDTRRLMTLKLSSPMIDTAPPFPISPSPTATSDSRSRSSTSHSGVDTPMTSLPTDSRGNSFDLPGLTSPSLIPILAKVEFDIDRKKATWYEPWIRSRRVNHAKRAESRLESVRKESSMDEEGEGGPRTAPLDLKLAQRMQTASPVSFLVSTSDGRTDSEESAGESIYEQLPGEDEGDEEEEEDDTDTARVMSMPGARDPLREVFGSDDESWAEIHRESKAYRQSKLRNPNIVELALNGEDLDSLPDTSMESELPSLDGEKELQELMEKMSPPPLSIVIPNSPPASFTKRRSSDVGSRKPAPPPLQLVANPTLEPADDPPSSGGHTHLAYFEPDRDLDASFEQARPPESEKRVGGVYEDLDLGLDFEDDPIDENDPHDRRRSQLLLKVKLDELERNLAQFSPRISTNKLLEEQQSQITDLDKSNSSPLNSDVFPPTPATGANLNLPEAGKAAWPAVPYSSLDGAAQAVTFTQAPPQLAVNGITTSAPKAYLANGRSTPGSASESTLRKRELEEEEQFSTVRPQPQTDNPIVPLSPDPFGRYPSSGGEQSARQSYWEDEHASPRDDDGTRASRVTSSRFSADSLYGEEGKPSMKNPGLISVKGIKKLWRKSNKSSVSSLAPSPPVSTPTDRTSMDIPSSRKTSYDQPVPPMRKTSIPPAPLSASLTVPKQPPRGEQDYLPQFDQESPYPIPRSAASSRNASPGMPSTPLPSVRESLSEKDKGTRKSILKSWKSVTSLAHSSKSSISENTGGGRPRRPSVLQFSNPTRSSTPDIPPSPAVPEQFSTQASRPSISGRPPPVKPTKSSSSDSSGSAVSSLPPQQAIPNTTPLQPSLDDDDTLERPSFDTSQFEIVSPKSQSLSYPYHTLDQ